MILYNTTFVVEEKIHDGFGRWHQPVFRQGARGCHFSALQPDGRGVSVPAGLSCHFLPECHDILRTGNQDAPGQAVPSAHAAGGLPVHRADGVGGTGHHGIPVCHTGGLSQGGVARGGKKTACIGRG